MKITIAGAGIGGLAAAAALAQRDHDVRVMEQAAEIGEVGAGIQISPNGMAVLKALGCDQSLDSVSIRADVVRLIEGSSGHSIATLNLRRYAPDLEWRLVHRARLVELLLSVVQNSGASVETNVKIDPPPGGAALEGDDLLIGADGLHSKVRARVDDASKPFFTGQVAWRALIHDTGAPVVEVHLGPGRHLVSYPLPNGIRNIVAVEERKAWADEGWSFTDHPSNLRAAFADFSPRIQGWLGQVEECFLWGLFRHRVADRWASGHQALLGDAAHPTLPFLAQGANLALEDAWVLSEEISNLGLNDGLVSYQNIRRGRAERVVEAATANARNYHFRFPASTVAHTALRIVNRISPDAPLRKFDWLYRHDVTAAS
ncbi:MAG: FAD-dependent oxidoreductase [Boseongicola sp.]